MSTHVSDHPTESYLSAIAHLPPGGTLTLYDVSWAEYEQLLEELNDSNAVRISYDHGRLDVMSPSQYHEMYKDLLLRVALAVADHLGCDFESRGSTTFKAGQFEQGVEPDTFFYIQNAARIIGRRRLDLFRDPPPDVIVEIDVSHGSRSRFDFYARIGVPEIWLYDERRAQIYHLQENEYIEATNSRAFPPLTAEVLTQCLEQSKTAGQSAALRSFRAWLTAPG
jgi:Uma2 family endonuclease